MTDVEWMEWSEVGHSSSSSSFPIPSYLLDIPFLSISIQIIIFLSSCSFRYSLVGHLLIRSYPYTLSSPSPSLSLFLSLFLSLPPSFSLYLYLSPNRSTSFTFYQSISIHQYASLPFCLPRSHSITYHLSLKLVTYLNVYLFHPFSFSMFLYFSI